MLLGPVTILFRQAGESGDPAQSAEEEEAAAAAAEELDGGGVQAVTPSLTRTRVPPQSPPLRVG
jgi:hypothetical protein